MQVYCLEILRAYPDRKRPSASSSVFFFPNPYDANEKRRQEKRKYYEDFMTHLKEIADRVPKDIDNIDEDEAQDYFYMENYMDMQPFSATLYEVTLEDTSVTSKRIPFPKCEKIEGYVTEEDSEKEEENENDENDGKDEDDEDHRDDEDCFYEKDSPELPLKANF
jgi:hypothetical protein